MIGLLVIFWLFGILGALRLFRESVSDVEWREMRSLIVGMCCAWPLVLALLAVVAIIAGVLEAL